MRFAFPEYAIDIEIKELNPCILVIENCKTYVDILEDLYRQEEGNVGQAVFSDDNTIFKFAKKVDIISNFFSLSCNDRKILNKIYVELERISLEKYIEENTDLNSQIVTYLDRIVQDMPYPIDYKLDFNIQGLLKLFDVKIDEEHSNLLERVMSYIKLQHQVCGIQLFIFNNLRQYFTAEQSRLIYEGCRYEQVCILDIEGADVSEHIEEEKYFIIDKDLCIIDIN